MSRDDASAAVRDPSALPSGAVLVAAAHKSSGKTTFCIGLCAALRASGLTVAPFKKGPDYIDPMWLARASARPCYNLDLHLMGPQEIPDLFRLRTRDADVALIEGNKGLHDGLNLDGSDSNAALARLLEVPVILVVDATGMSRGIAPLVLGMQSFDPRVRLAGVVLNRVGGARHEQKLRAALQHYTDVPVVGAIASDETLRMTERHLGLVPDRETAVADEFVDRMRVAVTQQVDVHRIRDLAAVRSAVTPERSPRPTTTLLRARRAPRTAVRIGIALDRAFGFYYADDLDAFRAAGAQLIPFDTLTDRALPRVDGLFIGGGFPETCAHELEANESLREAIRAAILRGLPTYAECGGLMYLAQGITWGERRYSMTGVLPGEVHMQSKPVGRGYVELESTGDSPLGMAAGVRLRAHEFHYSRIEGLPTDARYAYRVRRGFGIDGTHDGIVLGNVLASYAHLRDLAGSRWIQPFLNLVTQVRRGAQARSRTGAGATRELAW